MFYLVVPYVLVSPTLKQGLIDFRIGYCLVDDLINMSQYIIPAFISLHMGVVALHTRPEHAEYNIICNYLVRCCGPYTADHKAGPCTANLLSYIDDMVPIWFPPC